MQAAVALFAKRGELAEPRAFVPGEYGVNVSGGNIYGGGGMGGRGCALRVECNVNAKGTVACNIR